MKKRGKNLLAYNIAILEVILIISFAISLSFIIGSSFVSAQDPSEFVIPKVTNIKVPEGASNVIRFNADNPLVRDLVTDKGTLGEVKINGLSQEGSSYFAHLESPATLDGSQVDKV